MAVPGLKENGFRIKVVSAAVAALTAVITMVVLGLRHRAIEDLKGLGAIVMRGLILVGSDGSNINIHKFGRLSSCAGFFWWISRAFTYFKVFFAIVSVSEK